MNDNRQQLWSVFSVTGKVEDYLNYKATQMVNVDVLDKSNFRDEDIYKNYEDRDK